VRPSQAEREPTGSKRVWSNNAQIISPPTSLQQRITHALTPCLHLLCSDADVPLGCLECVVQFSIFCRFEGVASLAIGSTIPPRAWPQELGHNAQPRPPCPTVHLLIHTSPTCAVFAACRARHRHSFQEGVTNLNSTFLRTPTHSHQCRMRNVPFTHSRAALPSVPTTAFV